RELTVLRLFYAFFSACAGAHRVLPSFPTRRSSDLDDGERVGRDLLCQPPLAQQRAIEHGRLAGAEHGRDHRGVVELVGAVGRDRSEEHTSELQSRENLVCRLLLEKKKKSDTQTT